MSDAVASLVEQILRLPVEDRIAAMDRIWDSFDEATQDRLSLSEGDGDEDPAFQAELERRLAEVEEHPERLLDGPTVMAELRQHLARKRAQ